MKGIPAVLTIALCLEAPLFAGYKIKTFTPKPAKEYAAYQDFQNIVIAASPRLDQAGIDELFDTKKLLEKQIMPVVVVIENNNDFAVRINEGDIFLVPEDGTQIPSMPFDEVLLKLTTQKGLSTYSAPREILVKKVGSRDMVMDFEHKAFGERLIEPHGSDYGVLFFPLPAGGNLAGTRLYLPRVYNMTLHEPLVFFEFDLGKAK
jgi:hypothetical protein